MNIYITGVSIPPYRTMTGRESKGTKEEPKILLVEDDPKLGKTLSDVLKAKGYKPITVLTGEEGREVAKKDAFSLALIDLKLPDMSGIEVLKEISFMVVNMC